MQSQHNRTPTQLYIQGLLTSHSSGRTETEDICREGHAIDEGHITENDDSTVPPNTVSSN